MKVFLAGATGALGKRLIPLLVVGGHKVVGATRTLSKAETLRDTGVEAVVLDALNREAVLKAVTATRPDIVVHQLTALAHAELEEIRRGVRVDQPAADGGDRLSSRRGTSCRR